MKLAILHEQQKRNEEKIARLEMQCSEAQLAQKFAEEEALAARKKAADEQNKNFEFRSAFCNPEKAVELDSMFMELDKHFGTLDFVCPEDGPIVNQVDQEKYLGAVGEHIDGITESIRAQGFVESGNIRDFVTGRMTLIRDSMREADVV